MHSALLLWCTSWKCSIGAEFVFTIFVNRHTDRHTNTLAFWRRFNKQKHIFQPLIFNEFSYNFIFWWARGPDFCTIIVFLSNSQPCNNLFLIQVSFSKKPELPRKHHLLLMTLYTVLCMILILVMLPYLLSQPQLWKLWGSSKEV